MISKKVLITQNSFTQKRFGGIGWENEFKFAINDLCNQGLTFEDLEGYIHGLKLEFISSSVITIKPGVCINSLSDSYIISTNDITVDISQSGLNGLDTGTLSGSSFYYLFVVYNPTTDTIGGLFSISSTNPTLPSGFSKFRLIGSFPKGGITINFIQVGDGNLREFLYKNRQQVLTNDLTDSDAIIDITNYTGQNPKSLGESHPLLSVDHITRSNSSTDLKTFIEVGGDTLSLRSIINLVSGQKFGDNTCSGYVKTSTGDITIKKVNELGVSNINAYILGYRIEV